MQTDRPLLGILLMLGFCVVAPLGDALAKLLGEHMSIGQLLYVRFAVQALLLIPFMMLTNRSWRMTPRVLKLTFVRTILHILGIGFMFSSLKYLELADAVAIAFVMPFIMLLLGKYYLDEEVGTRRLIACTVGFIGTLLVVQPSFVEVGAPALLPLCVAVIFALFMLVTRKIAKEVDPLNLQAVSGIMAVVLLSPVMLLLGNGEFEFFQISRPPQNTWGLLLAIGGVGTVGHLLMTWSLRFAPSATLAPMQYLEIPFATLMGWWIFKDLPNGLAAVGIAITMGAGLYIVLRERAISRARPSVSAPPP